MFDSKCRGCENVLVGIEDGLWDTERLKANGYNIYSELDAIREYGSVEKHPVLGKGLKKQDCFIPGWPRPQATTDTLLEYSKRCDVIDIGGKNGPTWIGGLKFELGFYNAWRPAAYIRNAADAWLKSIDWGTSDGFPAIAVHSRIFWEGRHCR